MGGIRTVSGGVSSYGMQNGYGVPIAIPHGYSTPMAGMTMPNGYVAPMGSVGYGGMQMPPLPVQMMPMPGQIQQPGQQYDRVDRWRQSIIPQLADQWL